MIDMNPDLLRLIHQHGLRLTPQRKLILDVIHQSGGHLTIDQIYRRVRIQNEGVNLATVYRNLDVLCDLRLVVAADMGGGIRVYEIAGEQPHHHLVCRSCGAIVQIDHSLVIQMFRQIERYYQFSIDMDHMALFGLCARCRVENEACATPSDKQ